MHLQEGRVGLWNSLILFWTCQVIFTYRTNYWQMVKLRVTPHTWTGMKEKFTKVSIQLFSKFVKLWPETLQYYFCCMHAHSQYKIEYNIQTLLAVFTQKLLDVKLEQLLIINTAMSFLPSKYSQVYQYSITTVSVQYYYLLCSRVCTVPHRATVITHWVLHKSQRQMYTHTNVQTLLSSQNIPWQKGPKLFAAKTSKRPCLWLKSSRGIHGTQKCPHIPNQTETPEGNEWGIWK